MNEKVGFLVGLNRFFFFIWCEIFFMVVVSYLIIIEF